jgi:hypothetical protein
LLRSHASLILILYALLRPHALVLHLYAQLHLRALLRAHALLIFHLHACLRPHALWHPHGLLILPLPAWLRAQALRILSLLHLHGLLRLYSAWPQLEGKALALTARDDRALRQLTVLSSSDEISHSSDREGVDR